MVDIFLIDYTNKFLYTDYRIVDLCSKHHIQNNAIFAFNYVKSVLEKYYKQQKEYTVIINVKKIFESNSDYKIKELFEYVKGNHNGIIFIYPKTQNFDILCKALAGKSKIYDSKEVHKSDINSENSQIAISENNIGKGDKQISFDKIIKVQSDYIKHAIKESYVSFSNEFKKTSSSPIETNGEFCAEKIISNPRRFAWVSLKMFEEVEKQVLEGDIERQNIRLFSVSLKGAPFAAAIKKIQNDLDFDLDVRCKYELDIVNHLGPEDKMIENSVAKVNNLIQYICINDFILGGTEIKLAQHYLYPIKLNCFVAISSLFDKDKYTDNQSISALRTLGKMKDFCSGHKAKLIEE